MISRNLVAALVGLTLVAGTVADASATVATGQVATTSVAQTAATKSVAKVPATATATTPRVSKVVTRHHRLHVSHRAIKRMKVVKMTAGKRLVLSHATKRVAPKHA